MKSLSYCFALSLLCSFALLSADSQACDFPAIFNFGDSNSDTGGLSAAFGQAGPPHGQSFFGGPAGRYCDGRLVIDFIAERLRLPYLSAFLDAVGSNFSHGANFATAGSPIRQLNTTLRQSGFSPFSLDVQFTQFSNFHNRSQIFRNRGEVYRALLPEADHFSRGLYTFDIGQNDLTAGLFANKTINEVKADVPELIRQFKNVIKYIYEQGGRYFWIHNTGPIGCLAYVIERVPVNASEFDAHGCVEPFNQLAQHFNMLLKEAATQLRKVLPKAAVTYVDVYSVKHDLFIHAQGHGFTRSLVSCCGHGGKYNYNKNIWCGKKKIVKGKEIYIGKPCEDPSKAVVWDGVHYTEAGNKFIFERIVDGKLSEPSIPLNMACHRQ